jgi:hypothetical protein
MTIFSTQKSLEAGPSGKYSYKSNGAKFHTLFFLFYVRNYLGFANDSGGFIPVRRFHTSKTNLGILAQLFYLSGSATGGDPHGHIIFDYG